MQAIQLKKYKNKYINLSFGKDSTALWHVVMSVDNSIKTISYIVDHTIDLYNYKEMIEFYKNNCDIEIVNYTKDLETTNKNTHELWKENFHIGTDNLLFLGLRKQESSARRISLCKYGVIHETKGNIHCNPLADWTSTEVEIYIKANDLPVHTKYAKLGFGNHTRTATKISYRYNEEQLEELRILDNASYKKIKNNYEI
jgi:3'-phosphoadenosine 5'-phosphosulfate sulfotransferase (PAPS reductase)/FAD synthetase